MRINLPTDDTSQGVSDQKDTTTPLCVDLDGTLLRSDMLLESLLAMIKDNPASVFQLPFWMVKGKAHFKSQIASRVDFSSCHLPFNKEVVEYVLEQRASRRTVLVTVRLLTYLMICWTCKRTGKMTQSANGRWLPAL